MLVCVAKNNFCYWILNVAIDVQFDTNMTTVSHSHSFCCDIFVCCGFTNLAHAKAGRDLLSDVGNEEPVCWWWSVVLPASFLINNWSAVILGSNKLVLAPGLNENDLQLSTACSWSIGMNTAELKFVCMWFFALVPCNCLRTSHKHATTSQTRSGHDFEQNNELASLSVISAGLAVASEQL